MVLTLVRIQHRSLSAEEHGFGARVRLRPSRPEHTCLAMHQARSVLVLVGARHELHAETPDKAPTPCKLNRGSLSAPTQS